MLNYAISEKQLSHQSKNNSTLVTSWSLAAVTLAPGAVVGAAHQIALALVVRVAVALALPAEAGKPFAAVASITFAGLMAILVSATEEFHGALFVADALVTVLVCATEELPGAASLFVAGEFADALPLIGAGPGPVGCSVEVEPFVPEWFEIAVRRKP